MKTKKKKKRKGKITVITGNFLIKSRFISLKEFWFEFYIKKKKKNGYVLMDTFFSNRCGQHVEFDTSSTVQFETNLYRDYGWRK